MNYNLEHLFFYVIYDVLFLIKNSSKKFIAVDFFYLRHVINFKIKVIKVFLFGTEDPVLAHFLWKQAIEFPNDNLLK